MVEMIEIGYRILKEFISLVFTVFPYFILGSALGAFLETYFKPDFAFRYLKKGTSSVVNASILGAILPGCACTTMPMAEGLKRKGARLGTISAILGATTPIYAEHEGHSMQGQKEQAESKKTVPKKRYQCPMHPQVVSNKPGKCPICGMNLSEVIETQEEPSEEQAQESIVKIKEIQQELIGVRTESIVVRPLTQIIRTVAKIAYDPELYRAEQEFIQAVKMQEKLKASQSPEITERADALVGAASLKLKLQGLSQEQIEELKSKTASDRSLLISDALSPYVWAYLTIYEYDLGSIKIGDHVVLKAIAYPDEEFSGVVKAIDPVLDPDTRSVRVRVQIDNPQNKLKPNMYADAVIHIDLGERLAVPREAVLDTGIRKLVYIDLGKGQFKAQEVETGSEAIAMVNGQERKFFPAIKGLEENNIVVTSGNFLIDSQSQLTGGMSALWGGAMEIKEEGKAEIKTEHRH